MSESNRVISGSLFILASIAVAFILNFSQPIMIPFVLALDHGIRWMETVSQWCELAHGQQYWIGLQG